MLPLLALAGDFVLHPDEIMQYLELVLPGNRVPCVAPFDRHRLLALVARGGTRC